MEDMRMYTTVLVALAVTVAAPAPKEAPKKKETPGIVGVWTLDKAEAAGMALPVGALGDLTLTFSEDGTMVARKGGQETAENGRYSHDPKKSPAEIDFVENRAGAKEMTVHGIYKIDGEMLTICMAPMGARPTKFESPAGGQVILFTFKRAK
jgi:uncharacterized protein (TIGR03067 family)